MDTNPVNAASNLAALLDTYGPWAVMAVTIIVAVCVVWYLGRSMNTQIADLNAQIDQKNTVIQLKETQIENKDKLMLDLVEKRHIEFTQMMAETVQALSSSSATNERLIVLMDRCERINRA